MISEICAWEFGSLLALWLVTEKIRVVVNLVRSVGHGPGDD